jgi:hypothetical protein
MEDLKGSTFIVNSNAILLSLINPDHSMWPHAASGSYPFSGVSSRGGAPPPPLDLAALQREVEAEERRLKEAEKAKSLRERFARLRKRRVEIEARMEPSPKPKLRREATDMPAGADQAAMIKAAKK